MTISTGISRTTLLMNTDQLLSSLRRSQEQLLKAQKEITTGYSVERPSEAPEKTAAIQLLRQQLMSRGQHEQNLEFALGLLNFSDESLGDVNTILLEAKGIASQEASFTSNEETRANQAAVIDAQIDALVEIANRQFQGLSIFSGNRSPAPGENVLVEFLGGLRYVGSTNANLQGDFGLSAALDFNSNGADTFGSLSSRVMSQADFDPAATAGTHLSDVNGAQGVGIRKGTIQVTINGTGVVVDLNTANTLGDVVARVNNAINNVDPTAGALALTNNGFELTANAGHTIAIADIQAAETAADLGIELSATSAVAAGGDINPRLTIHTRLADLNTSVDFASGLSISQGATTKVADFSTANTVQDMINIVEQLNLGLRMEINETGSALNLVSEVSGLELSIGENGGTTAQDMGLRTFGLETELSAFRFGLGVKAETGEDDLRFQLHNGTTFEVNLDGANTVSEVLTSIQNAATTAGLTVGMPGDGGTDINIGLASIGNGFVFEDGTAGGSDFRITELRSSLAGTHLGIARNAGTGNTITGDDNAKVRVESVFTHMMNLSKSLQQNDTLGITLAGSGLETDIDKASRVRADIGVRANRMSQSIERSAQMKITEQSMLSNLREADLTEVITRFTQLQQQLQASLQVGGTMSRLSLLDFLR